MRNTPKSASAKKGRKRAAPAASPALNLTPKEAAALRAAVERVIAKGTNKAVAGA